MLANPFIIVIQLNTSKSYNEFMNVYKEDPHAHDLENRIKRVVSFVSGKINSKSKVLFTNDKLEKEQVIGFTIVEMRIPKLNFKFKHKRIGEHIFWSCVK